MKYRKSKSSPKTKFCYQNTDNDNAGFHLKCNENTGFPVEVQRATPAPQQSPLPHFAMRHSSSSTGRVCQASKDTQNGLHSMLPRTSSQFQSGSHFRFCFFCVHMKDQQFSMPFELRRRHLRRLWMQQFLKRPASCPNIGLAYWTRVADLCFALTLLQCRSVYLFMDINCTVCGKWRYLSMPATGDLEPVTFCHFQLVFVISVISKSQFTSKWRCMFHSAG